METYQRERLLVDFYSSFLSSEEAVALFQHLEENISWNKPGRRDNRNYGDPSVSYEIIVGYNRPSGPITIKREVEPWGLGAPGAVLWAIKERLSVLTGSQYNYVVVQRYPNGNVGINPHRDKEMVHGTDVAGVSLGATRNLTLSPPNWLSEHQLDLPLTPGSLYVLKPPTNDHWVHSIQKDSSISGPRISLTYRYTEAPLQITQQITESLALVSIEELFTYHPQVKRVGVIPYAFYQGEGFWLMGRSNLGRFGDFGGGCHASRGETPIGCLLREVNEESSGVLTELIRDSIGRREGLILWRSKGQDSYRYLLLASIPYQDYTLSFNPNVEVQEMVWVRQSQVVNPKIDLNIFQKSLHQFIRQFQR